MFFTANNIVETPDSENATANRRIVQQRKAIFLTEVGPEVYSVLSNLLSPAKPKDSTLEDIIRRLKDHHGPAPLEITESFHFGMRNQNPGESINDYIVALKKLSIHCNYGEFLNRALRDRFACGLNSVKIQNKLLNTSALTFDTACQIAISMELADKNSRELSRPNSGVGPEATSSVNKLSASESVRGAMVTTHLSLANLRMQHAIDVRRSDILLWCVKNRGSREASQRRRNSAPRRQISLTEMQWIIKVRMMNWGFLDFMLRAQK